MKKMWSKGRESNSVAVCAAPSTTATSFGGNTALMMSLTTPFVWGVNSDGLRIAELPAATAETRGPRARLNG